MFFDDQGKGRQQQDMNAYCDYHPLDAARWHCTSCQKRFCAACMPDIPPGQNHASCPSCQTALQFLGIGDTIEPFWNRLPAFFKYPFNPNTLAIIIGYSLLVFAFWSFFRNFIVYLFLFATLLKYLYYLVEYTADGHLEPAPISAAYGDGRFAVAGKQLLVFLLMFLLIFGAAMIGGKPLALIATCLLVLAMPASTLVLAMDGRALAAVNPVFLATLIARIGWPYFVLYGHLVLLMLIGGTVQEFAVAHLHGGLGELVASLVNCYFAVIFFHMLGYLLYQYQDKLGFVSSHQGDITRFVANPEARLDADLDIHLKEGRYDQVQKRLLDALQRDSGNPKRLAQLYRLLHARDDTDGLFAQRQQLLPWLLRQPDEKALGATLRLLIKSQPGFVLENPQLACQCAQQLERQGQHKLALHLLKDFHKRFPDASELADAYLLVARTLANQLHDWDKAIQVLSFIDKRCQGHRLHAQIGHNLTQAKAHQPLAPASAAT